MILFCSLCLWYTHHTSRWGQREKSFNLLLFFYTVTEALQGWEMFYLTRWKLRRIYKCINKINIQLKSLWSCYNTPSVGLSPLNRNLVTKPSSCMFELIHLIVSIIVLLIYNATRVVKYGRILTCSVGV